MEGARLGPEHRAASIERMRRETFDVAIVGGGVVGAGAALDAATRGLTVALIEQRDWASGTSSRSSKLIHGGLRYLEQGEIGLVREARHEQSLMLSRLCPHLVSPVSFLLPLSPKPPSHCPQRPLLRLLNRNLNPKKKCGPAIMWSVSVH